MIPLFLDFETTFTKDITLKKMSLRRYLAAADITMLCVRFEGESYVIRPHELSAYTPTLAELFRRDDVVVVAHNTAFDLRVAKYKMGLPYPQHSLCTLELSRAAWPGMFQRYSLAELGVSVPGLPQKIEIDLTCCTAAELEAYCLRDVEVCEALYHQAIRRVPPIEQAVCRMTGEVRGLSLVIDQARAAAARTAIQAAANSEAAVAGQALGMEVFGDDNGVVRSVNPARVKKALLEELGFRTDSISSKKQNQNRLRENPAAGAALAAVGKTNSALSMVRRIKGVQGDDEADLNLTAHGSHTGRWTGTSTGKGINFLNLPKHNAVIAKPMRQMYTVKDRLLVRADAANLEYRMIGWWTKCKHVEAMFTNDVFANPYIAFGQEVTGKTCTKKEPTYKVWKETCLGLGFGMGVSAHATRLAALLAKEAASTKPGITLSDFEAICTTNNWQMPRDPHLSKLLNEGMRPAVVAVAYHTHRKFHELHPELRRATGYITGLVEAVSSAGDPEQALRLYQDRNLRNGLDPARVKFEIDHGGLNRTLKISCGPWVPTLRWANLGVRMTKFGMAMCVATSRGDRALRGTHMLENITQAMGRNAMAFGMLKLWADGWPAPLNVHDEVLLAVPEDLSVLSAARDAIQEVFRPGGYVAWKFDYACIMDPKEITVSRTMWDASPDDICPNLWDRIAAGDKSILALLP